MAYKNADTYIIGIKYIINDSYNTNFISYKIWIDADGDEEGVIDNYVYGRVYKNTNGQDSLVIDKILDCIIDAGDPSIINKVKNLYENAKFLRLKSF